MWAEPFMWWQQQAAAMEANFIIFCIFWSSCFPDYLMFTLIPVISQPDERLFGSSEPTVCLVCSSPL